ncbi:MAG: mechanosensitive ion channel [Bacteroidales bacterium]
MNSWQRFLEKFNNFWGAEIFQLGGTAITPGSLFMIILSLFLLFYITGKLHKLLIKRIFPRYNIDPGVGVSMATLTRYLLIVIGLVIIFQTSGIDLTALGILFGALGIGIGFGLQNITSNFISGIIILFEKPVKIGDRVEVDDIVGNIVKISARATTIINNDNIAVVVPNSEFINGKVINWSLNDRNVRFNFPVGVSYNEDPMKIKKILLDVAYANSGVMKNPPPDVLFQEFGDSSLDFNLRVWTQKYSDRPMVLKSQLYYAIFEKFKEYGVEIPFPQRDVHFKSGFGEMPVVPKSQ